MLDSVMNLFGLRRTVGRRLPDPPRLLVLQSCLAAAQSALAPATQQGHEGIVYLLGRTDGVTTLAVAIFRPDAVTTYGSFHVSASAMASCVNCAEGFGLQVVGQLIHTPARHTTATATSKARAFDIRDMCRS